MFKIEEKNESDMENKNLLFSVQLNETPFTRSVKTMKTYMNRFIIAEDDQVRNQQQWKFCG